jgi:hypothetical protein
VQILHEEHAIPRDPWVHLFERRELLAHRVPAVIDDDVDRTEPVGEGAQKGAVLLVPDEDGDPLSLHRLAAWVDVDAEDACPRSEVLTPHLQ